LQSLYREHVAYFFDISGHCVGATTREACAMNARLALSVLLPFLALTLQWLLWPWIAPFVWFLFFPTVFFSARLGGLWGGLTSTVLSAGMVWYFFIPPQLSWAVDNPANLYSVGLFVIMGYLFCDTQARLRRAQRNTEAALAETRITNEQITRLYQKTLELDELKSQFFANVSHELRTPLTLIMSPLARRLAATGLSPEQRREDEMMLRNARLLYSHVSDLLDAAKLESGRMPVDYAQVELGGLTRAMASQFDSLAREKNIAYRIDAPTPLVAEADAEKLQRILLNLLSNAFKFTPGGGCVEVRLRAEAGQAVIEVQDNGPGVPANLREAAFERFRQLEGGAQRRFGGTGLGLAIVKEFAELHGGSASVDEADGGGALFAVRLPLHAPAGALIQDTASRLDPLIDQQAVNELRPPVLNTAYPAATQPGANAPLVLVVEDNADMNAFIAEALSPHYRVACAFDGRQGLELALALQPDLVLSDVMMPRLSGDQMVQALRRQPGLAELPIVILTAKADDDLRVRLLKDGVQDYLNKPFAVEELLARVGSLIKDRKRAADKLGESETRFEATFEQAAMGIALVAPSGRLLRVNRKLCEIIGYSEEELLARTFQEITHPDDLQTDLDQVQQMLSAEIRSYAMEKRYIRKDNTLVWINLTVALVRKPDATPDYFIAVVEDVQARKQAEDEIRRLNSDLERRVIERTAELTVANRELDAFVYAVSHDLRAPLRAMSGFSQALVEDYGEQLQGEAKLYLEQIDIASHKMSALIDGLLVLSRSTRGELQHDAVDLSSLSERLLAELMRSDPGRQVAVQVEAGLRAHGDERMIEVVMCNLLDNAWKYTAYAAAPSIRIYAEEQDGMHRFCVADNGAGFDMSHANRLFQPFQRLHRQEEFPGIGIGLATVERIVHRHGGVIEAQGEVGKGALFCFTLPNLPADSLRGEEKAQ